jgi:uncharacterized protein YndB with AHSA1/START domain
MGTFRIFLGILSTVAIVAMLWYSYEVFGVDPLADKEEYRDYALQGLKALHLSEPGWQTMVIASSKEIDAPREKVWEAWSRLDKWVLWSAIHLSAAWKSEPEWKAGREFEEVMRVGWPYETWDALERIELVFVPDRALYVREGAVPASSTFWRFEHLPDGRTKVLAVEVLHSNEIGFLRPLIEKRWQAYLDGSMNGLAEYVQHAK